MARPLFVVLGAAGVIALIAGSLDKRPTVAGGYFGGPDVTINMQDLPTRLPPAVRSRERSVVAVNVQLRTTHRPLYSVRDPGSYGISGSGVVLAPRLVVSAGHVFAPPSISQNGGPAVCYWTSVDASTTHMHGRWRDGEPVFGTQHHVRHIEFELRAQSSANPSDASLLHVSGEGVRGVGTIPIAPHAPAPGARLYFINYQSAAGGRLRDPFTGLISKAALRAGMRFPVIFGGFAVDREGDTLNVIDGLHSYGVTHAAYLRPGGSGGAVLNSEGQLVGISDESITIPADRWQQSFAAKFTHVPAGYSLALSGVQLVTRGWLRSLAENRTSTGHC